MSSDIVKAGTGGKTDARQNGGLGMPHIKNRMLLWRLLLGVQTFRGVAERSLLVQGRAHSRVGWRGSGQC